MTWLRAGVIELASSDRPSLAPARRLPITQMATAVERFLTISTSRTWDQFKDIPWEQLDAGRLTEAHVSAVKFVTFIEDHLPGYFALYQEKFPLNERTELDEFMHNREFYHFTVKWAQEEDRHAHVLFTYQVRAGFAEPDDLRRELAIEGAKRFDVPYVEPVQIFTYTLLQEKATQLFYQQLGQRVREPVLRCILGHLSRDEARHFSFFAQVMQAYVQRFGADLVPEVKDVLQHFRMPLAETLNHYRRWALDASDAAGGYDHTAAYEELVRVVERAADAPTRARSLDLADLVAAIRR
jgi:acyl-[acyl-carrier-protein] desaturase